MTRTRTGDNPAAALVGNMPDDKRDRIAGKLRAFAKANKDRIACTICGNLVLPEKMDEHVRAFHP